MHSIQPIRSSLIEIFSIKTTFVDLYGWFAVRHDRGCIDRRGIDRCENSCWYGVGIDGVDVE
ncbi:hypothetical protein BDK88_2421 [Natrinema hispanicum]|uniref:Uncharacterized protein n=1 Tax=Natrinema hispanicum TaxID=392421 RepID=A0A482YH21_9EURY|nr:hypothetical protein BDK88_2421 [Natrinema hispanicum]